jgi:hypothetical protein
LIKECLKEKGEPMTAKAISEYVNARSHWGTTPYQIGAIMTTRSEYAKVGFVGTIHNVATYDFKEKK